MSDAYPKFQFSSGDISHPVYRIGEPGRASVLLIQELPGITPETLELAKRLCNDGFTVYLPHLFGEFGGKYAPVKNLGDICIRREFYLLDRRKSAPFTQWLRALCQRMQEESGRPVGAIGHCLTGRFVIPLVIDAACAAPVACQPSHLGQIWRSEWKSSLGLDDADEEWAVEAARKHEIPLTIMRFKRDPTCPKQRFDAIERKFGERLTRIELESPKKSAHSVLTIDYDSTPGSDTYKAYQQLVAFFQSRLLETA